MNRKSLILLLAFAPLLFVACNEFNSERGNNDATTEPEPQTSLEWANHGTRLLNNGLPEQALVSYDKAIRLDATIPYTYCSKASAYQKLNKPMLAIQNADKALQLDPEYTPAMANKAKALRKLGRDVEADSVLKKAFEINPEIKKHFKK